LECNWRDDKVSLRCDRTLGFRGREKFSTVMLPSDGGFGGIERLSTTLGAGYEDATGLPTCLPKGNWRARRGTATSDANRSSDSSSGMKGLEQRPGNADRGGARLAGVGDSARDRCEDKEPRAGKREVKVVGEEMGEAPADSESQRGGVVCWACFGELGTRGSE
jgi:hypothetical protein